ncbi:MAG: hypothetical protein QOF88_6624, partial [Mycobacterium sp.]|nr:hypothetical protein [Mycobacterium sp.]
MTDTCPTRPSVPPIVCAPWCDDGDGHPNEWCAEDQTCWGASTYLTPLELEPAVPGIGGEPYPARLGAMPHRLHPAAAAEVYLHADPVGQLPHADADERDLLISCGASLHHGVAALAALGWAAKVHRLPDPDDAHHLAALRVHPHPAADLDTGWPRRYR